MINPHQVRTALQAGLSFAQIARRLGCSVRHVRRLAAGQCITPNPLVGTYLEWVLWQTACNAGYSLRQIAYRYCVSHETVRKTLHAKTASFASFINVDTPG